MNSIKGMPCSAICLAVLQKKMRKRVETGGGGSARKLPFSVFGVNCTPLNANCREIIINKA